ncbi:anthranilate synthase component I [Natronoarchaeum rubrum]|uniref:anthranilate synthase component I n=1 Tax=Natronoarchaeum rubrum TaxID=755311 RepID=UPI0021111400|nr:anthranilate synthase component I [Natronoarchaeum rubrum]
MTPELTPGRETFRQHVADAAISGDEGTDAAVVRTSVELDVNATPLSAYAALTGRTTDLPPAEYAFLLESAEKTASSDPDGAFRPTSASADRHARYSFVGYDPAAVVTVDPDETDVEVLGDDRYDDLIDPNGGDATETLRSALPDADLAGFENGDRRQLDGGLVGFLAYDAVYDLWLDEVGVERPDSRFPDAQFVLNTKTLVFDEVAETLSLVFTPVVRTEDDVDAIYDDLVAEAERVADLLGDADAPECGPFVRDREIAGPQDEYEDAVRAAKEHVLDGDVYQAVVSRKRELYGDVDPLGFYRALRSVNPSPYMYLLGYDDLTVVGASPETLVSVEDDVVTANPIAGTCPRGPSPVEDRRLAGEMLADGKERAEHTMLVDLARNDVRRVSESGSVRVDEFMNVLKYSHVQHIESTVTGRLSPDSDAFEATRASFPAGTLSGAPKIRAMEIIDDLELSPRGLYGGGVGYFSWTGDAELAIVIRTATIEHGAEEDRITVQAGAGLVADSDPTAEYEETEQKMDGVLTALDRIERDPDGDAGAAPDAEDGAAPDADAEAEPEVGR